MALRAAVDAERYMDMKRHVSITIFGNVESGRTEAELYHDGTCVAIVYEDSGGWKIERLVDLQVPLNAGEIGLAQDELKVYMNRCGQKPPLGLSATGMSFWLMEKEDGTSMGVSTGGRPSAI